MLYLVLCVGLWQMNGCFLFLVLFFVAMLNFWNSIGEKKRKAQNQQQIWEEGTSLLFATVKVLWRWGNFLGRNSTACLKQMQPKLLIHRTYCWSPRRSQLATCRRADTSSCLFPKGRRSIRISVALQNILVDLCEVQSMLFLKKQTLTVYKMHRLEKNGEASNRALFSCSIYSCLHTSLV